MVVWNATNFVHQYCGQETFDVTEPLQVQIMSDSSDGFCPKRVRVRMNDKKTYYTTGKLPNVFKYVPDNEKIYHTEHIIDDKCILDDLTCKR